MQRRQFLSCAALSAFAAQKFSRPLGINLFTVRSSLAKSPADTYSALAAMNIRQLEVRPPQLEQHASLLQEHKLQPVHLFIETPIVTGAWDEWAEFGARMASRFKMQAPKGNSRRPTLEDMIALAQRHGIRRLGTSMLLPGERARAIDQINAAAEKCAQAGLGFYYHNHAYEFAGQKGERYLDQLRSGLSRKVMLELDVFWASISGENPARLLEEWKGRVCSVHLKDLAPDAKLVGDEASMPPSAFREAGAGTIDWPGLLRAAQAAKVEHYLLELDHSPGDPLDSVRKSADFLRSVKF